MSPKLSVLSIALSAALAGSALAETTTTTTTVTIEEPEVRTIVTEAGYRNPTVIAHEGEIWRVESMDRDTDDDVTLFVTNDGKILGAAELYELKGPEFAIVTEPLTGPLNETSVTTVVSNAGFHNVHDIDYLDGKGVWKAEADDITGEDFEIHVDSNGRIVHIEGD
jgi:hypothetical protein